MHVRTGVDQQDMRLLVLSIDDFSQKGTSPRILGTITLASALARHADVTLAVTTKMNTAHLPAGLEYIELGGRVGTGELGNPFCALANLRRLYRTIAHLSSDYDALYTDAAYYPSLGKRYGAYLVEVNGLLAPELRMKRYIPMRRILSVIGGLLQARTLQRADAVVAVTERLREHLIEEYGVEPHRCRYVPNGVDRARFEDLPASAIDAIREKYGLVHGRTVVFVGSFRPWHGVLEIVDAFDRALTAHPSLKRSARLLMVGDGPLRTDAEALASTLTNADRISFTGAVPKEAVPQHLAASDIGVHYAVVSPRLKLIGESPLKIGEYMAAGLAVVAGPLPYVCSEEAAAGAVMGVSDRAALERALAQLLLSRADARAVAEKGNAYCAENLSIEATASEIYALIESTFEDGYGPSSFRTHSRPLDGSKSEVSDR